MLTTDTPVQAAGAVRQREPARVQGRLRLSFERRPDTNSTTLSVREQQPPLRVVRAFPIDHGATLVHLHNLSGGVLGGDRLELDVEVAAGARAQLTSTGATRVYRGREGQPAAEQRTDVRVQADGLLEYLPDPLIPYAGSRYRQTTRIELAAGAGLFWWEALAPGREAHGELFAYDLLHLKLDLLADGRPVALERIKLEPAARPLTSFARLGPYTYYATMYICYVGWDEARWLALEAQLAAIATPLGRPDQLLWGVSMLPAHGLIVRGLSRHGRMIAPGLLAFWQAAKQALYGQDALPPRKVY